MSNKQVVSIDTIRSVAHGSITSNYTVIGTPFTTAVRVICITNNTDGDVILSDDGTNDKLFIPKQSFRLYDVCSNRLGNIVQGWFFPVNTQFYVKYSSAPTTGSIYLEALWGDV